MRRLAPVALSRVVVSALEAVGVGGQPAHGLGVDRRCGFEPVRQIAIYEDRSAPRIRRAEFAARRLTLEQGAVPSLDTVAKAAGVSKGGLIHHFPSRASLVSGLARVALDDVNADMTAAATAGNAARAWLDLSVLGTADRALLRSLASELRPTDASSRELLADATSAIARWEEMIAAEVGSAVQARAIRLVGDALVANALFDIDAATADVDDLYAFLTRKTTP